MKKFSQSDIIQGVCFDLQESIKDLFAILLNLQKDMNKIKSTLKDKNIPD